MRPHFYQHIQGWFDYLDIYWSIVQMAPQDRSSHFVEVGTWVGRSAAFMSIEIANSGKPISFDCVDSWEGTGHPGEYEDHKDKIEQGLYEQFINNMQPVEGMYRAERGLSHEVASRYPDGSLDFVFIDAGHSYDEVYADLTAWIPKIKKGGWIAGHDYFTAPDGVGRAVKEKFRKFKTAGSCWYSRCGSDDFSELEVSLKAYRKANFTLSRRILDRITKLRRSVSLSF